jgi:hypothetical protein
LVLQKFTKLLSNFFRIIDTRKHYILYQNTSPTVPGDKCWSDSDWLGNKHTVSSKDWLSHDWLIIWIVFHAKL